MQIREQFKKLINFRAKLYRAENKTMSFIIEEAKETVPDISQGRVKVL